MPGWVEVENVSFDGGPDLPSRGSNGHGRHVRLGATVEQCKELGIGFSVSLSQPGSRLRSNG